LIEFLHLATSGISLVLVGVGLYFAFQVAKKGSTIRRIAIVAVIAIILEALLGAGLVLLKLVEFDQSAARAISISLHLVNTLFLVATLTTQVWATGNRIHADNKSDRNILPRHALFWTTLGAFLVLGVSGAITALGDTLFPAKSLVSGMNQDFAAGAHFLVRLRVFHPVLAAIWVALAFLWSRQLESLELRQVRAWFLGLVMTQFLIGFLNWALMAPNILQLIHLLVADLVFISFWYSGLNHEARKSRI
jgi:heme A synthase